MIKLGSVMKLNYLLATFLAFVAIGGAMIFTYNKGIIQEYFPPISVNGHGTQDTQSTGSAIFKLSERLNAFVPYSLCFNYNTTGLAKPVLQLSDAVNGSYPIYIELPRNSFGLGDVCLKITPHYNYPLPTLAFSDQSNGKSSMQVHGWVISHFSAALAPPFYRSVISSDVADVYLENNFFRLKFILPLMLFLTLWIGAGIVITSCISGLIKFEVVLIAPIAGMTFIAFLAYFLSLIGVYSASSLILFSLIAVLFVLNRKLASGQSIWPTKSISLVSAENTSVSTNFNCIFDVIAGLLIFFVLYKYLFVASTPFFATWDGLVSWNKWGVDWATRELRGNYQFTYPQMIPLFYSVYYKLAGYSASDPLSLSMNSVHFLITYIGLLALPLVYSCAKALKISPIIPVCLVLLSDKFFGGMNNGFVDNALVTYCLACVLLILRSKPSPNKRSNLLSALAICLVGAGAIFLKQTGIFASTAILVFLMVYYRGVVLSKVGLFWSMLIFSVPVEFYLHEIVLDLYPTLVEDNPLNHSIGGILSNASLQLHLVSPASTWYTNLAGKLAALSGQHLPESGLAAVTLAIVVTLVVIGSFARVLLGLYRMKEWPALLVWGFIVGGQLLIAAKFGSADETRYILALIPLVALLSGILVHKLIMVRLKGLTLAAAVGGGRWRHIRLLYWHLLLRSPRPRPLHLKMDSIQFLSRSGSSVSFIPVTCRSANTLFLRKTRALDCLLNQISWFGHTQYTIALQKARLLKWRKYINRATFIIQCRPANVLKVLRRCRWMSVHLPSVGKNKRDILSPPKALVFYL